MIASTQNAPHLGNYYAPGLEPGNQTRKFEMLDLNDDKAIDYSSNLPFLPYEATGNYVFDIVSYEEKPEAYNGAIDIVTVEVKEASNTAIRVGQKFVFVFKTAVTGKAKAFAAARLRGFIAAAVGAVNDKAFDANAARKALLVENLSSGGNLVRMSRRNKPGRGENQGKEFSDDRFEAHTG